MGRHLAHVPLGELRSGGIAERPAKNHDGASCDSNKCDINTCKDGTSGSGDPVSCSYDESYDGKLEIRRVR